MLKTRSMITLVAALTVICTSACIAVHVQKGPSLPPCEPGHAGFENFGEEAEELEMLRHHAQILERENAELAEHIEMLQQALDEKRDEDGDRE